MKYILKYEIKIFQFENQEFLNKVRTYFLDMSNYWNDENIKVIDANRKIGEVFESVKEMIDEVVPY